MAILARSIIQESPIIQDIDVIDYSLDATGDSLKYSSSPYTLKNLYKLLFSIPKIIGEKNRRKGSEKFNGSDIVLTGTITSSGVAVTGSGTLFTTELEIGDWIAGSSGEFREVASIISDTSLTLSNAFTSDILTGQSISRMQYFSERMDRIESYYKIIGEPFPVIDSIVGSIIPDEKYFIKLSKDLTGSGLYNENKLTGQLTSVTGEQTFYSAVVSDTDSPLFGQTIPLINSTIDNNSGLTAPTVISASETSGLVRHNRFQGHYYRHGTTGTTYAIGWDGTGGSIYTQVPTGGSSGFITSLPQALQSDGIHGTPRNDYTTEQNNVTATFYMRIK